MNKKIIKLNTVFFIFFFLISFYGFANPFTGNKNSPTPVQQAKPLNSILNGQRILNQKLADYIYEWKNEKNISVLLSILFISFLYGMIHAAGPGHRKTVVFSFYMTRKAKLYEPFLLSTALAAIHGGSAIILMLIFKQVSGSILAKSNNTVIYMEGISFLILSLISVFGLTEAIAEILKKRDNEYKAVKLSGILISGIYPCPAAILVLVLAISLNVIGLGCFAVIVMSIGMSIPINIAAYLSWLGRKSLFFKLKKQEKKAIVIGSLLKITGYSFLLIISIKAVLPFLISVIKILLKS